MNIVVYHIFSFIRRTRLKDALQTFHLDAVNVHKLKIPPKYLVIRRNHYRITDPFKLVHFRYPKVNYQPVSLGIFLRWIIYFIDLVVDNLL